MKKTLSIFLAVLMVITALPLTAITSFAATSGDFEYEVISEYDKTCEITDYTGTATELAIPSTLNGYSVTSIGNWAFDGCTSLASITIPDSVTTIGNGAFNGCTSLASITIPDSVTSIGMHAFWECTALTSITIPDSVTSIGYGAFPYCTSLESINVSNDNTAYSSVDGVLFNKDKTELIQYPVGNARTTYIIPDSVTTIGHYAFRGCTSLTSITLPVSVTEIGESSFSDCTSLTDVYYTSTESWWNEISISIGNQYLTSATIHYDDNNNVENPIMSISAVSNRNYIENIEGYYTTDSIYDENGYYMGESEEYFYYSVDDSDFYYVVTLKDGSTIEGDAWEISDAIGYWPHVETNQSYENQWSLGKNEVEISLLGVKGIAEVEVVESPIESISAVSNSNYIENYDGYYKTDSIYDENDYYIGESEEYFYYSVSDSDFNYVVTLKDGSTIEGAAWEIDDAIGYRPQIDTNQSYDNQWGVGTHEVEISLIGVTTTAEVEVVEYPIESISAVSNRNYIENIEGYYTTDSIYDENGYYIGESEEYFYYSVDDSDFYYVVTLKDGSTIEGDDWDIYNAIGYWPYVETNQSYENQWSLGKNEVEISLLGVKGLAEVEVVESPIESISAVSNRSYVENYDGRYETDSYYDAADNYIETEEYFYYSVDGSHFDYVVTFKDGSTIEGDDWDIYNAIGYWPHVETNQSYDNQWSLGKHEVEISLMGVTTTAEVEVVENPVKSITVKQGKDLEEGIHGYYRTDSLYDEDGNYIGKSDVYFRYDVYAAALEYIIEYKDDTILQGSEYDIYKETGREIELSSTQNNEKQWSVGTNPLNVSFMGIETTAQIKVVENSVDRIIVKDVKLIENADGYWSYDNDEPYFYYDKDPSYTVVMKDGTRYESSYYGDAYVGDYDIYPYIETDQSYDNQWGLGKHTAKMYLAGKEIEFVAEVVETPIEKMTITPVRDLISGIDNSDYIGYLDFNVEIKFKDGTTDKCLASDLGYKYGYRFEMFESEDAIGVGHFSFIGYEGAYEFKFIENPYESIEISGTDELTIKFNRLDGTSEIAKAIDYDWRTGDVGFNGGYIITDKGAYPAGMRYLFDENEGAEYPNKDVTFVIGEMESNTLETNNWYLTLSKSKYYFSKISSYKFLSDNKFSGIDATSANANVTDLIGIAIQVLQDEYKWKWEEEIVDGQYYCYGIYNVDDVVEMVERVFGISKVDYTKHPGYNSEYGTIKVPEIPGYGDASEYFKIVYDEVFSNGKWTITQTCYSYYDATVTTTLILNEKGQIEKISYFKGVADGWTLENGKWAFYENGVKVTNRWVKDSKGWCYLGADGYCVTNQWKADSKGWCYLDNNGRMVINNWVNDNGKWYFLDANGYMVSNCWKKDSKGWCYLGSSGAMLTNAWVKDSVGWCYVGADGYCVTNTWKKDSHGWCYLDANGRMATNKWIKDSVGWCYVGADGYCVTNTWKKDSHGWCYLDSNGRMATNKWIKDSVGWCYVGADGYCVTNAWKADSKGWCYLDANGRMMTNSWLQWNGNWYYLDENGYMVTGTKVINGKTYKFNSNGVWIG